MSEVRTVERNMIPHRAYYHFASFRGCRQLKLILLEEDELYNPLHDFLWRAHITTQVSTSNHGIDRVTASYPSFSTNKLIPKGLTLNWIHAFKNPRPIIEMPQKIIWAEEKCYIQNYFFNGPRSCLVMAIGTIINNHCIL